MSLDVRLSLFGLLLVLPALSGCYAYQEIERSAMQPGMELRVNLTREAVLDVEESLGVLRPVMEGRVESMQGTELFFSIVENNPSVGFGQAELRQRLRFDLEDLLRVETRELDRRRTAGFIGGLGVVGALLIFQLTRGGEAGGYVGPEGPIGGEV